MLVFDWNRYFKGIDWDAIVRKEVEPPFIPPVKGKNDTSQVC